MLFYLVQFFYRVIFKICTFAGISCSFSSDGEDYILLKYLRGLKDCHYIDIGSHKPIKSSNTFFLYLLGWKGVCVDPLPMRSLKRFYKIFRNKDIFITSGVLGDIKSDNSPELTFFYYENHPDNSTFDEKSVQTLIDLYNRHPSSTIKVPVLSVRNLIDIYKNNFSHNGVVHLLNLDTEGGELCILQDFFSEGIFPWFICVEELGFIADNLVESPLNKLVLDHDYILVSKTFLSSIYMKKNTHKFLQSAFVRGLDL